MKTSKKVTLLTAISIAMAFTFSCSSDSSSEPKYFYSWYGIKIEDCPANMQDFNSSMLNASFDDVGKAYDGLRSVGVFLGSESGLTESEMRNDGTKRGITPYELDELIKRLKERGNSILAFNSSAPEKYCADILYLEKE